MDRKHSSNLYYFVAALFFLTAWWVVSMTEGGEGIWIILSSLIAFTGFSIALEGMRTAVSEPSPFSSRTGKFLWAIRPRAWLVAWGVILLVASLYGTPHMLFKYNSHTCIYIGLKGAVTRPTDGDGSFMGCRLWKGI